MKKPGFYYVSVSPQDWPLLSVPDISFILRVKGGHSVNYRWSYSVEFESFDVEAGDDCLLFSDRHPIISEGDKCFLCVDLNSFDDSLTVQVSIDFLN